MFGSKIVPASELVRICYNLRVRKVSFWLLFVITVWFLVRFVIGGPEDDWICVEGQWVKHGSPSAPMPEGECDK